MNKERPILFSAPMVRALLAGTKTQTRRALKEQPLDIIPMTGEHAGREWVGLMTKDPGPQGKAIKCRYGLPGDRLYVRETWAWPGEEEVIYRADPDSVALVERWKADPNFPQVNWKPSIHMRRIHSRVTLAITDVRVERLQNISEEDAKVEGAAFTCDQCGNDLDDPHGAEVHAACDREYDESSSHKIGYRRLWESINGKGSWEFNPWVWVVCFALQTESRPRAAAKATVMTRGGARGLGFTPIKETAK